MSSLVSPSPSRPSRSTYVRALPPPGRAGLIAALHAAVGRLVAQPAGWRSEGASDPIAGPLRVRSLRRKPGRGMVVVYGPRRLDPPGVTLVTATVAEEAMSSAELPRLLAALAPDGWRGRWPGIVHTPTPGVRVQAFPADAELPALAAAVDTTSGSRLLAVLTEVAGELNGRPGAQLVSADAEVVRYRPGTRCVLRYGVTTDGAGRGSPLEGARRHVLFGKLYQQRGAALAAHGLAERLWQLATRGGAVYLPRPLRVEADMALVLSEAAGGIEEGAAIAGTTLLRAAAGSVAADALRTAADALAWWHTADIDIAVSAARTATNESRRAQARLNLLAAALPRSEALHSIGDELRTALAEAQCGRLRLVHGAFRPNQLVFIGPSRAAITDLDGAGAGDPAVDVGDFCAHLRPPGLWCGEADQRAWWEVANGIFQDRYREAMVRAGTAPAEISGTLQRAALFEASSIVKMAGHRSRHLSSGRPREVATMLAEAGRCLARYQMWPEGLG